VPTVISFVRTRGVYAWIAFALPAAGIFGHALAPGAQIWKSQDFGVLASVAMAGLVLALWALYRRQAGSTALVTAFMAVIGLAWLITVVRIQADGSVFTLGAFALPIVVVALWSKPPGAGDMRIAGLVLAYGLAVAALLSIPLGLLGVMPSGFDEADSAACRTPILCDLTGGLDRWAGPFGSVNYAAPAGGLILVLALAGRGVHRWLLGSAGLIVLGLSQGRSALLGVLVAVLVLVLWGRRVSDSSRRGLIRGVVITGALAGVIAYIVVLDPTFNGRTPIWADFSRLWASAPLAGVGDSGVADYIAGREGLLTFSHAHSALFDTLVRWGMLPALLGVTSFVLAGIVAGRALRAVGPGPLAVVAFVVAAGLTETIHGWAYWSAYLAALTWSVLTAQAARRAPVTLMPSLS
jgi:hypothetical protein